MRPAQKASHYRLDFEFSDAFVPLFTLATGPLGSCKVWVTGLRVWLTERRASRSLAYEREVDGAWVACTSAEVTHEQWGEVRLFIRTGGANSAAPRTQMLLARVG